jgi:hypothetical protein
MEAMREAFELLDGSGAKQLIPKEFFCCDEEAHFTLIGFNRSSCLLGSGYSISSGWCNGHGATWSVCPNISEFTVNRLDDRMKKRSKKGRRDGSRQPAYALILETSRNLEERVSVSHLVQSARDYCAALSEHRSIMTELELHLPFTLHCIICEFIGYTKGDSPLTLYPVTQDDIALWRRPENQLRRSVRAFGE